MTGGARTQHRYQAVSPQEAWPNQRPPKQQARKHQAHPHLIANLHQYTRARTFTHVQSGPEPTHKGAIAQRIALAAALGGPGHTIAADDTQRRFSTRRKTD